jgi:hypothetical protein
VVCDKCSLHKLPLRGKQEAERTCNKCNDHIAHGNFSCIVRYIAVLRGGPESTTAAQRFVALRQLAEALDPLSRKPWKCAPGSDPNIERVADLQVGVLACVPQTPLKRED